MRVWYKIDGDKIDVTFNNLELRVRRFHLNVRLLYLLGRIPGIAGSREVRLE